MIRKFGLIMALILAFSFVVISENAYSQVSIVPGEGEEEKIGIPTPPDCIHPIEKKDDCQGEVSLDVVGVPERSSASESFVVGRYDVANVSEFTGQIREIESLLSLVKKGKIMPLDVIATTHSLEGPISNGCFDALLSVIVTNIPAEPLSVGTELKNEMNIKVAKEEPCSGGERSFGDKIDIFVAAVSPAAPPRLRVRSDRSEPNKLMDALMKAGMSRERAQKLVSHIIQEINKKKPGEEGERLIRSITGETSPSKQGKLATSWAKIKAKY